jgi:hypothetical protein
VLRSKHRRATLLGQIDIRGQADVRRVRDQEGVRPCLRWSRQDELERLGVLSPLLLRERVGQRHAGFHFGSILEPRVFTSAAISAAAYLAHGDAHRPKRLTDTLTLLPPRIGEIALGGAVGKIVGISITLIGVGGTVAKVHHVAAASTGLRLDPSRERVLPSIRVSALVPLNQFHAGALWLRRTCTP